MGRKYSVEEIDSLRKSIRCMLFPYEYAGGRGYSTVETTERVETEKHYRIEETVRTYMLNGTNPQDLEHYQTEYRTRSDKYWTDYDKRQAELEAVRNELAYTIKPAQPSTTPWYRKLYDA